MTTHNPFLLGPETIRVERAEVVVGRAQDADVQLLHPAVSRRHALLGAADGRLWVTTLGGQTGVRVNGKTVMTGQDLQDGDRVDFGPVSYHVVGKHLRLLDRPEGVRLEVRGLAVTRGGVHLLSGVDLVLAPSQFVGILGASGAGKTSLLKCLAGYFPPAAGQLLHDGVPVSARRDGGLEGVGYVPQEDVLYSTLTGRENLDFALQLRAPNLLKAEERAQVVAAALDRVRLADDADKRVAVLSGGQRKRLNVALELLTRPRLLFLDEPTSGLDPAGETRLMRLLKELAGRGITVVCSTHVMANVEQFDQVVVVAEQTVIYVGPPGRLLDHFRVPDYPALYEVLENGLPRQDPPASPSPALTPSAPSPVLQHVQLVTPAVAPAEAAGHIPLAAQILVQVRRGALLVWRDKGLLVLLAGQPLLIGMLINLAELRPTGLAPIFLFCVVTAIWLGLNNTAREAVRERPTYVRERMAGATPEGYLLAKLLLYGAVGLAQVVLLLLVVRHLNFLSDGDASDLKAWPLLYLTAVLWGAYLAALLLGLLVSTLANTEEAAVAALPLIILPQLLLSGVVTGLDSARDGSFRSLVLLVGKAGESSRGLMGWLLELLSLVTYSRPANVLLQELRADHTSAPKGIVRLVDALHLLLLLLATATVLVVAFRRRERSWIERG